MKWFVRNSRLNLCGLSALALLSTSCGLLNSKLSNWGNSPRNDAITNCTEVAGQQYRDWCSELISRCDDKAERDKIFEDMDKYSILSPEETSSNLSDQEKTARCYSLDLSIIAGPLSELQNLQNTTIQLGNQVADFLGPIFSISLKSNKKGDICLTRTSNSAGSLSWNECRYNDTQQQFHFIAQQEISFEISNKRLANREKSSAEQKGLAFKLLSVKEAIDKFYSLESGDDLKDINCVSLSSGGEQASCDSADYFMFAPNRYGRNQALPNYITDYKVDSQEGKIYTSLLVFADDKINGIISENIVKQEKIDYKVVFETLAPLDEDPFSGIDIKAEACSDPTILADNEAEKALISLYNTESIGSFQSGSLFKKCTTCRDLRLVGFVDDYQTYRKSCSKQLPDELKNPSLTPMFQDVANYRVYHLGMRQESKSIWLNPILSKDGYTDIIDQQENEFDNIAISLQMCSQEPNSRIGLCTNQDTAPVKKLIDFMYELRNGPIIQLEDDNEKCATVVNINGSMKIEFQSCEDRSETTRSRFRWKKFDRLFKGSHPNGSRFGQLVWEGSNGETSLCVNLGEKYQLEDCLNSDGSGLETDISEKGIFELTTDNEFFFGFDRVKKYNIHTCAIVSTDLLGNAIDCRYEEPKRFKLFKLLSYVLLSLLVLIVPAAILGWSPAAIGVLSIFLSTPTYVFDGLLCFQNESKTYQAEGCNALKLGVTLDVALFGLVDAGRLGSTLFHKATMSASKAPFIKNGVEAYRFWRFGKFLRSHAVLNGGSRGIDPDRVFHLKFLRMVLERRLSKNDILEVMKKVISPEYAKKFCGPIDCRHPMMKTANWVTEKGRNDYLTTLLKVHSEVAQGADNITVSQSRFKNALVTFLYGNNMKDSYKAVSDQLRTLLQSDDVSEIIFARAELNNLYEKSYTKSLSQ